MKKTLFVVSALLLGGLMLAPSAFAQDASSAAQPTPTGKSGGHKSGGAHKSAGRADAELADLSTTLNLTDDQKAKIKPILDDESAKVHAAKMAATGSADDQKAKTKAIREDHNSQIRALLTPDQQKTFDGMKKHKKKEAAPTV